MMCDKKVYLEKRDCFQYPDADNYYSPHIMYPEYPFAENTISSKPNEVYDMVRSSLKGLGLDKDHFGKAEWNPLGDYVKNNAHILIKPNFVNHKNPAGGLDCTVTHPSVIRCMIDYCVIAGASLIEVADAPIQNCDFERLMNIHGYNRMFDFIRSNKINILVRDLRLTKTKVLPFGIFLQKRSESSDSNNVCEFNLETTSFFNALQGKQQYKIANYSDEVVNSWHNDGHHKYLIDKSLLEADLIINLPKPKTHRFAGITGAQKNFIGVCPDKEYLPHYRTGCPQNGGDETDRLTWLKNVFSAINRQRCKYIAKQNNCMQLFYILLWNMVKVFAKLFFNKGLKFSSGQWWGNDTIWRTTLDLNSIMLYGDTDGSVNFDRKPRNILNIGDMIIAGEKSGPLEPLPKQLGIILASGNCAAFDYVFCRITGFDYQVIPTINNAVNSSCLLNGSLNEINLYSNIAEYNNIPLEDNFEFPDDWNFIPNPLWNDIL